MLGKLLLLTVVALACGRPQLDRDGDLVFPDSRCSNKQGHYLIPHESNCYQFYHCENGLRLFEPADCAPGTEFNAAKQVCVHESESGCLLSGAPVPENLFPAEVGQEVPAPEVLAPEDIDQGAPAPEVLAPEDIDQERPSSIPASIVTTARPRPPGDGDLPNGCPADWDEHRLLPHEECNKFYYCVFGELKERRCARGTYFNPKIQVCDWPENVECAGDQGGNNPSGSSEHSSSVEGPEDSNSGDEEWWDNGCPRNIHKHWLLPHATDCTKFYYCHHGKTVERHCPPHLHFHPALQVCDWPAQAGCDSRDSREPVDSGEPNVPGDSREPVESGEPDVPGDSREPVESGEPDVPRDSREPVESGEPDVPGDSREPVESREPGDSREPERSSETRESGEPDQDGPSSIPAGIVTTARPRPPGDGDLPNGCPADRDEHRLLPHEECNKFYYCVNGELVERRCARGTYFNPKIQVCDWPENVECAGDQGGNNPSGSSEHSSSVEGPEDSNSGDEEWWDNGCPRDIHKHWLLPHTTDCTKFYYCHHGKTVERHCPPNLHFHRALQVCDWPAQAGCDSRDSREPVDSGEPNVPGDSREPVESGEPDVPGDSREPVESGEPDVPGDSREPVESREPGDSREPERSSESRESGEPDQDGPSSIPAGIVTTARPRPPGDGDLPNGCPADRDEHRLLPHEECNKFYYCVNGELVERRCARGTYFNPKIQVCDWPENVECAGDQGGTNPGGSPEYNSSEKEPEDNNSGDNNSGDNNSGDNGWLNNGCPTDWDKHWLLPHDTNCSRFHYCLHGERVERECPGALHFNQTLQVCDWPENVKCAGSGDNNSGDNNSGDNNSEDNNSGDNNSGDNNSGDNNSEDNNSGDNNSGDNNSGDNNSGDNNSEDNNSGDNNSGDNNSGDNNSGDNNSEDNNSGDNGWLNNGCPTDWNKHWLLPHDTDCSSFHYCLHGERVERHCPARLHFNPTLQVCDWPHNAGCTGSVGGDSNESDSKNPSEETSEENNNRESLENGCPADFDEHRLVAADDCGSFYYCVFGQLVRSECPPGLHFNSELQVCDWPSSAGCETVEVPDPENSNSSETVEVPDPENSNSSETVEVPDPENSNSSETIEVPDPENSNSSETVEVPEPEDSDSSEPEENRCIHGCNVPPWKHESNCDKFWRCEGNNEVLVTCSEGLHFNDNSGTCDHICNAGCERDHVESTGNAQGLKVFIPWAKVDKKMKEILHLQ